MEDPFLNYFALGLLFFVIIVLVYGIIAIHDIPARIAKARHHPHEDAIHAAGWISLFMLHVLWPFLWIWAMAYKPGRGWGFSHKPGDPTSPVEAVAELEELKHRLAAVEFFEKAGGAPRPYPNQRFRLSRSRSLRMSKPCRRGPRALRDSRHTLRSPIGRPLWKYC